MIERGVAAGDDERQERVLGWIVGERRGVDVAFQVIHPDERQAVRPRQRLRERAAHQEGADEAGAVRHRDPVQIGQSETRLVERTLDDGHDHLEMAARRELGYDAAVRGVDGVLGGDDARTHAAAVLEDGRRGLIAGALDPENDHRAERNGVSGPW